MTLTLDNFVRTVQAGGGRYLLNSVVMSVAVAVIGVVLGVLLAYFTARHEGKIGRVLHLIAMSTGAIPGVVLGLSYVLLFKGSPIYGTIFILILVNIIHFFSSPYLMIYTSFSKMNENLESVASTLGFGRRRLLLNVFIPRCRSTIGEMFAYFFVNGMMTISAVSFLANTVNKPIALMINQFEAQAQMEYAAVVSLMILVVNIAVKAVFEMKKIKE
jgi:iron(III) transport system permease protein